MKRVHLGRNTVYYLSANDTYKWANKPGARWPCSTLAGKRVRAEYFGSDLVDLSIDGGDADDIDAHELNAMIQDVRDRYDD